MKEGYFPITPAATPFSKVKKEHNTPRNHKAESSLIAEDPNLTIRPSHAIKRGVPCQDIFYSKADLSSAAEILSPPNSGHLLPMSSTDLPEFPSLEFAMTPTETYRSPHCSPGSNALSSAISSFQSSPEIAHLSLLSDHDKGSFSIANVGKMPNLLTAESIMDLGAPPSPTKSISPSRSQSVSDIDLNAIVEDTGITSEEIAIFIGGPDPLDGKWTCMYEDCGRSFGRKENIKSHVQTHLGDRQYRCIHCGNTFVRQHDLKRHAKIHSGIKPYPCDCGRSFARHDALTRHRQRNTCIGGFEGMSKKPTKRGRPKKVRPSADERIQKASKTRQRVLEKAYPSSMSGSSECSFPSPPQTFENLPDLPSSQMMSRESTSTYFSSSSELDLLASPTPFLDFDFSPDVGKGSTDAPSFSSSFEEFGSYDDMDKMLLEFSKTGTEEKEPSFTLRMAEDALFGGQSWAEDFKERGGCFDDLY